MDKDIENIISEMHNKNSLINTKKGLLRAVLFLIL